MRRNKKYLHAFKISLQITKFWDTFALPYIYEYRNNVYQSMNHTLRNCGLSGHPTSATFVIMKTIVLTKNRLQIVLKCLVCLRVGSCILALCTKAHARSKKKQNLYMHDFNRLICEKSKFLAKQVSACCTAFTDYGWRPARPAPPERNSQYSVALYSLSLTLVSVFIRNPPLLMEKTILN